jgi:putative PIN family toxin of toxin-antitoxin system
LDASARFTLARFGGIAYDTQVSRIIIDTNVLVAGLRSRRGASFQVLSMVGSGRFEHVVSVALLFEYEDALKRPDSGIKIGRTAVDDILDFVCSTAIHQSIYFLWRPVLRDPGDDFVLEAAVHGQCDTIVTFNLRDFSDASRFGLRVQTPQQFLNSLKVA